jgi:hypothetical protein
MTSTFLVVVKWKSHKAVHDVTLVRLLTLLLSGQMDPYLVPLLALNLGYVLILMHLREMGLLWHRSVSSSSASGL